MSKLTQIALEGKMQQIMYFDKTLLKKLKAYALEIDTPFQKLIEPETNQFVQLLLSKCHQIDDIRMKALEQMRKEKEVQELSDQNPLPIISHEVEPIPI